MGRKCKLTPEVQQRVVECLGLGSNRANAAAAAGVGETTFYRWMERGEASSKGIFREFWEAVRAAELDAELTALRHWHTAMPNDWRACKEFLERRFPKRWGLKQAGSEAGPRHEVYVVREDQLTEEEWQQMIESERHSHR